VVVGVEEIAEEVVVVCRLDSFAGFGVGQGSVVEAVV
jgi:hypothetical protein